MTSVTIILTDRPDGSVECKVDKGELGEHYTPAQEMASVMLSALLEDVEIDEDEDEA